MVYPNIMSKELYPWINKHFVKYRKSENNKRKSTTFKLRPNQELVRDYMSYETPYRGILLYHGLGSGKTCTSIAIAEQQKEKRNILVLSPASLRANYIHQLVNDCGDPKYKKNPKLIEEYYTFIAYNASNTIEQLDNKVPSLDNHTIIIDETHNLVSIMMSGILGNSKNGKFIYDQLINAKNVKIIASASSSSLLKDPHAYLTGRSIMKTILPLDFSPKFHLY